MKVTVLIPTYNRNELLSLGLESILRQVTQVQGNCSWNILVLNDGLPGDRELYDLLRSFALSGLNISLLDTRTQDQGSTIWRVPGYAMNIGFRVCHDTDYFILTCPEVWHHSKYNFHLILGSMLGNNRLNGLDLYTPETILDDDGTLIGLLRNRGVTGQPCYDPNPLPPELGSSRRLDSRYPFFLAVPRSTLLSIGGYDEDFTGIAAEDDDLLDRLTLYGCVYNRVPITVVHLRHDRVSKCFAKDPRYHHNVNLYATRKGIMIRNKGKDWGSTEGLCCSVPMKIK